MLYYTHESTVLTYEICLKLLLAQMLSQYFWQCSGTGIEEIFLDT